MVPCGLLAGILRSGHGLLPQSRGGVSRGEGTCHPLAVRHGRGKGPAVRAQPSTGVCESAGVSSALYLEVRSSSSWAVCTPLSTPSRSKCTDFFTVLVSADPSPDALPSGSLVKLGQRFLSSDSSHCSVFGGLRTCFLYLGN